MSLNFTSRFWELLLLGFLLTLNAPILRGQRDNSEEDPLTEWVECRKNDGLSQLLTKVKLSTRGDLERLSADLGERGFGLVEKINRRDREHLNGAEIYVPCANLSERDLSPFPLYLSDFDETPKIFVVSLRVQAFGAYQKGSLVRWGPISSGHRNQQTPAGLYHTNCKALRRVSTVDSNWIMPWYFNLHSSMGVAFHQYSLPGYPASYGCIRLLERDAKWIFNWADGWERAPESAIPEAYGTPVIVFEKYDYESSLPWQVNEPLQVTVGEEEIRRVFRKYSWIISRRVEERAALMQEDRVRSPLDQGNCSDFISGSR